MPQDAPKENEMITDAVGNETEDEVGPGYDWDACERGDHRNYGEPSLGNHPQGGFGIIRFCDCGSVDVLHDIPLWLVEGWREQIAAFDNDTLLDTINKYTFDPQPDPTERDPNDHRGFLMFMREEAEKRGLEVPIEGRLEETRQSTTLA